MSVGTVQRPSLTVGGQDIATDQLGYLLDPEEWTRSTARAIAAIEGIELAEPHWVVIDVVRAEYAARQSVPEARVVLKRMAEVLGPERATRRYLHQLFPYGYGPQVCKIAGMRMPRKVMLDV